jgi:hypothetical protein
MKDNEFDYMIGHEVEVLNDEGKVIKKVKVKSYKIHNDHAMFLSEDGELYDEDEINWVYRLTEPALLAVWLQSNSYKIGMVCSDKYAREHADTLFNSWMNQLIKYGEIANDKEESEEKAIKEGDDIMFDWIRKNRLLIADVIKEENILTVNMGAMELLFDNLMSTLMDKGILAKVEE